jgi:outer membrane biosynthesis protein TonB
VKLSGTQLDSRPGGLPQQRQPSALMVGTGIATTVLLHLAVVGLIIWGSLRSADEPDEPAMLEFEDVELLALGEEKPPNQLPRIANPAPPETQEDTVNLAEPDDEPEPEPEEQPEEKDEPDPPPEPEDDRRERMLEDLSDLNDPDRPSNTDVPEGSEEGVAGGTISDPAMANMMNTYQARVMKAIVSHWQLPTTLDDSEIKQLAGQVAVYVRLSASGHVVSYSFQRKSPNDQFNGSIERVLRRFQVTGGGRTLPVPDQEQVREAVLRQGLNLRSWDAVK